MLLVSALDFALFRGASAAKGPCMQAQAGRLRTGHPVTLLREPVAEQLTARAPCELDSSTLIERGVEAGSRVANGGIRVHRASFGCQRLELSLTESGHELGS